MSESHVYVLSLENEIIGVYSKLSNVLMARAAEKRKRMNELYDYRITRFKLNVSGTDDILLN